MFLVVWFFLLFCFALFCLVPSFEIGVYFALIAHLTSDLAKFQGLTGPMGSWPPQWTAQIWGKERAVNMWLAVVWVDVFLRCKKKYCDGLAYERVDLHCTFRYLMTSTLHGNEVSKKFPFREPANEFARQSVPKFFWRLWVAQGGRTPSMAWQSGEHTVSTLVILIKWDRSSRPGRDMQLSSNNWLKKPKRHEAA